MDLLRWSEDDRPATLHFDLVRGAVAGPCGGAAEWVGVGADVFASLGTVGAFATGMVLFRREHRREEVLAEEERRDQAVKVSAWIEASRTPSGGRELNFHVHDASQMSIYEVALRNPTADDEADEAEFIGLVAPGQTIRRPASKE